MNTAVMVPLLTDTAVPLMPRKWKKTLRNTLFLPGCVLVVCKEGWYGKERSIVDKRCSFAFIAAFILRCTVLWTGVSVPGKVRQDR